MSLQALQHTVAQLLHNFDDIQPTLLLFLQKLQCIAITDRTVKGKDAVMLRRQLPNGVVELRYGSEAQHSQKWLVVHCTVQPGILSLPQTYNGHHGTVLNSRSWHHLGCLSWSTA